MGAVRPVPRGTSIVFGGKVSRIFFNLPHRPPLVYTLHEREMRVSERLSEPEEELNLTVSFVSVSACDSAH